MPVHNWSRVSDGMFHWFHQCWIGTIADWLNHGERCPVVVEPIAVGDVLPPWEVYPGP